MYCIENWNSCEEFTNKPNALHIAHLLFLRRVASS